MRYIETHGVDASSGLVVYYVALNMKSYLLKNEMDQISHNFGYAE